MGGAPSHSRHCFLALSPTDPDAACTCAAEYAPGDLVEDFDGNIWRRIEEVKRYPGEPPHTWTDNTSSTGDHMPVPPLVRLTRAAS